MKSGCSKKMWNELILYFVVKLNDLFRVLRQIKIHILKGQVVFISTKEYNNVHGGLPWWRSG